MKAAGAQPLDGTTRSRGLTDRLLKFRTTLDFVWQRLPAGLYVFNYHRVGDADATPFDPNVYSCDEATFRDHVRLLKSNFDVVGADEVVAFAKGAPPKDARLAVITFDDGYRDNFTAAFPILREEQTTAIFFLPTAFVGAPTIPWWDEIAWLIKNTTQDTITASWLPQPAPRDVSKLRDVVAKVLTAFKASPLDAKLKVEELRRTLQCELCERDEASLFVTWDDVLAMHRNGMHIGSHAHSHQILAHLSREEQQYELTTSKAILEAHLGGRVDTVAYPVGTKGAFDANTLELARSCGYKAGFSYISGVNRSHNRLPFELRRISVDNNPRPLSVKLSTLLATDVGLRAKGLLSQQRHLLRSLRKRIR